MPKSTRRGGLDPYQYWILWVLKLAGRYWPGSAMSVRSNSPASPRTATAFRDTLRKRLVDDCATRHYP
jgi:hypothetical protein